MPKIQVQRLIPQRETTRADKKIRGHNSLESSGTTPGNSLEQDIVPNTIESTHNKPLLKKPRDSNPEVIPQGSTTQGKIFSCVTNTYPK